jgi:hypothetical protein
MAEEEAEAGSMMDSVILVIVRSRLAGRKFFTPEIKFSKLAPTPDSFREDVKREEILEKPRKRSDEGWDDVGCVGGAEVIIVMRVVARTLKNKSIAVLLSDKKKGQLTA